MFRQITARRLFSITPRRSNLISDLYISNIKEFKPTPLSSKEIDSAVKAFSLPAKPTLPAEEISSDLLKEYESTEVETLGAPTGSAPAQAEDWFVFEEEADSHH